jgi:AAA15 family ATPase/GTPase
MFIKKVKVKGYKTIKDMEADFNPGLNIIIGDNGSGKTNFLEVLMRTFQLNFPRFFNSFSSSITFSDGINIEAINMLTDINEKTLNEERSLVKYRVINANYKIDQNISDRDELMSLYKTYDAPAREMKYVYHGYPKSAVFLNYAISGRATFTTEEECTDAILGLFSFNTTNSYTSAFFASFKIKLILYAVSDYDGFKSLLLETAGNICTYVKTYLKKCTPIEDIRLAESFSMEVLPNSISVQNLYFEFYQNDRWNNYNELSDGTKRLLTILFNILDYNKVRDAKPDSGVIVEKRKEIIVIEEPELGINPHQLYKLMLILQEEAINKQIIITTHSPIALDILEQKDLDNILICSYTNEKGTQLNHLTEQEKQKAIAYMEDVGYLSLYWTHSDLEKRID